jgi:hypothetical protein
VDFKLPRMYINVQCLIVLVEMALHVSQNALLPSFTILKFHLILVQPEGKFLVTKLEFRGSLDMSFEGDCHDVGVIPNLELLVTFGRSLS